MRILFNDVLQEAALPAALKTGALAERYIFPTFGERVITAELPHPAYIDCVGIGGTDGTYFSVSFDGFDGWLLDGGTALTNESAYEYLFDGGGAYDGDYRYLLGEDRGDWREGFSQTVYFGGNGLYRLDRPVITKRAVIETDATYIGRVGMGRCVKLGTAIAKEPSFCHSAKPRLTLSGQTIPGIGGYSYRAVSLDVRYKIGHSEMAEIKAAYGTQTGPGLPFFLLFEEELRRLPFVRLYAADTKNDSETFQSGVHGRFLFSRKFEFEERF
jgi:hypothetical protein